MYHEKGFFSCFCEGFVVVVKRIAVFEELLETWTVQNL